MSEAQALTEVMPGGHPEGGKGHIALEPDDYRNLAFFRNAKTFSLYELDGINDRALEVIANNLPASVEKIAMEGIAGNGAGISHFRGNTTLKTFNLFFNQKVTDIVLEHLAEIPNLEAINLSGNPDLKGDGIEFLEQLKHLKSLNLNGTGISDKTLSAIGKLEQLESLSINDTTITGDALIGFLSDKNNVPNLQVLSFKSTGKAKLALKKNEKKQLLMVRPGLKVNL